MRLLVCTGPSFTEAGAFFGEPIPFEKLTELDAKGWDLYHVAEEFAENYNLANINLENVAEAVKAWLEEGRKVADEVRGKLIELIGTWYVEVDKYKVLPVDSRGTLRSADERPQIAADPGAPVCSFYQGPFEYEGKIVEADFSGGGEAVTDGEMELKRILARQQFPKAPPGARHF